MTVVNRMACVLDWLISCTGCLIGCFISPLNGWSVWLGVCKLILQLKLSIHSTEFQPISQSVSSSLSLLSTWYMKLIENINLIISSTIVTVLNSTRRLVIGRHWVHVGWSMSWIDHCTWWLKKRWAASDLLIGWLRNLRKDHIELTALLDCLIAWLLIAWLLDCLTV